MPHVEQGPSFPLYVNDDGTIGKEYKYNDGSIWRVNDASMIESHERFESKWASDNEAFHNKLMSMGVVAYRCNDGWVDRKNHKVLFKVHHEEKGWYWHGPKLKVGDKLFIGDRSRGGRFALVKELLPEFDVYECIYEPLEETLDGKDGPYLTKYTWHPTWWEKHFGEKPYLLKDIYDDNED